MEGQKRTTMLNVIYVLKSNFQNIKNQHQIPSNLKGWILHFSL